MTGEGKRYSPFDADEVHADMRADPVGTRRSLARQPAVAERHRDCETCAALLPAPVPVRVAKIRLGLQEISDALALPPGCRVLRMFVVDDPHALCVVVEGDGLEPVLDGVEAPYLTF